MCRSLACLTATDAFRNRIVHYPSPYNTYIRDGVQHARTLGWVVVKCSSNTGGMDGQHTGSGLNSSERTNFMSS